MRFNMEDLVDSFDWDFKRALEHFLKEVAPETNVDRNAAFKQFKKSVRKKFNTVDQFPDRAKR